MKKWLRIICLVLVIACIIPCAVACQDNGNNDDGPITEKAELPKTCSGDTYDGKTFTIYSVEDMFEKKYFFADKVTGDGMNDALYNRQKNTESALNVQLVYKAAEGSGNTAAFVAYADEIKNSIASRLEKYQLVLTHSYYALPTLIDENLLMDMASLDSVKAGMEQTETDAYWNTDIMEQISYNGKNYLGYSNFNLARTYVVAFNKSLYASYESAFDGDTMYDYVTDGTWTLDTMISASKKVYAENNGVSNNIYGLTGQLWVPFIGFVNASGESYVSQKADGTYSLSFSDDSTILSKFNKLANKIVELDKIDETHFWRIKDITGVEPTTVTLSSGRAFMQLMSTNELISLKDQKVSFGVLPYPKYDKDQQEYYSLNWAGYMAVPSNISDKGMVGDVIECLSAYSDDVTTYYYEKLLGLKVSEAKEDAKMLDYVWDSLCSDFGVTFCMVDEQNIEPIVYSIPRSMHMSGTVWNTFIRSYKSAANKALAGISENS